MKLGNNSLIGFRLARSKLKDPQTIVVGAPPPPQRATLRWALAPISRKLHLGRVRGLSRNPIEVPRASKKQSPPVRGIGSGIPSTLSQQLPRESMAKCAKSVGDIFLSEGVTFSSVCFSCITPHGAVASSLCRPKAVTCIVLKMSVIGSIGNLPTGICVDYFPLQTLESNPILEAFTVPVLWVPKAIQTTIPRF